MFANVELITKCYAMDERLGTVKTFTSKSSFLTGKQKFSRFF